MIASMFKIVLGAVLSLAALTTTASAHERGNGYDSVNNYRQGEIDRREAIQEQRIQNARRSGELTREEYRHLEAEQARIHQMERAAKADGRIDGREAEQIRRAQNEASRHIAQESHNNERARRGRWW